MRSRVETEIYRHAMRNRLDLHLFLLKLYIYHDCVSVLKHGDKGIQ